MSGDHNMYQKPYSYLDFECQIKGEEREPLFWSVSDGWVYDDDTSENHVDETVKQKHDPVAHVYLFDKDGRPLVAWDNAKDIKLGDKLYAAPKQWVGLTDDAVFELADTNLYDGGKNFGVLAFAKAIEQALKEKNHG